MPCNMTVAKWIDRVEIISKRSSLLDRETKKLIEHNTICKVITPNIPRVWKRNHILKEDKAKMLKAAKTILKTTKKAHGNGKVEEEPSAKKKLKKSVSNPTDAIAGSNRLVEPSCVEISDPSELPRFDGKLIF